jgi:pimeloyl-ACP methyl ester carboxylesterase
MREFFGHAAPRNEEDFQKTTYYANWRNAKWHNRWVCFERLETPLLIIHGAEDKAVAPFLGDQVFRSSAPAWQRRRRCEGRGQLIAASG